MKGGSKGNVSKPGKYNHSNPKKGKSIGSGHGRKSGGMKKAGKRKM